jgi:hypothetical protein
LNSLEARINYQLNKFPAMKKIIKRVYQLSMYALSSKIKSEGDIQRISPNDGMEYFFGYYDKSPWDAAGRYILCLRAKDAHSSVAPAEAAEIILFDTQNNNSYKVLGKTNSWNVQQGCMLQWLGSEEIIYNDFKEGQYCSVILNIQSNEERIIPMPVYSVSQDGKFALSLDFSRLHRLRKGYGYSNLPDPTKNKKCPDKPCIWRINLENGEIKPLMKYTDFASFEPRHEMKNAEHKVNHIMLNPLGDRFMVLHRWFDGSRKYTRLVTVNSDGTDMYNLSDDDMTSHCCWKNDIEILAYARKKDNGNGYFLMKDKTQKYHRLWPELGSDGHPSYSPDGRLIVTDTYPDRGRIASVYCISGDKINKLARVFAPFRYDNDVRCDLHPRWNRTGEMLCFDSVFEGLRGLYVLEVNMC